MSDRKVRESLGNLERALARLGEAVQVDESNALVVDGTIQRFEFALELLWKTLKRMLEFEGVNGAGSPRAIMKEAYAQGWLEEESVWLSMLEDRNKTSHTYDEESARKIYMNIKVYYPVMCKLHTALKAKLDVM